MPKLLPREAPQPAGRQEEDALPGLRVGRTVKRLPRVSGGVLSGLLLLIAFPPFDQRWIALLALVPLLLALRGSSARLGFLIGGAFGVAFFGILLYWISYFGFAAWIVLTL